MNEQDLEDLYLTYWEGHEEPDPLLMDELKDFFPINPDPAKLVNSFAVKHPRHFTTPSGIAPPHIVIDTGDNLYSLWFFLPLDPREVSTRSGKPSQHNLFLAVRHHYAALLEGEQLSQFPNPAFWEVGEWRSPKASFLTDMKKELLRAHAWGLQTPEFLSRGGSANSPSQRKAREAALLKGRAARSAEAQAKRGRLLEAVEQGRTHADIAEALGIKESSVRRLLHRASAQE